MKHKSKTPILRIFYKIIVPPKVCHNYNLTIITISISFSMEDENLNQYEINQIIEKEKIKQAEYVTETELILKNLLTTYFYLHKDDTDSENYKNAMIVNQILCESEWYKNHDLVWFVFLELRNNASIQYIIKHANSQSSFYKIDLVKRQRYIDPNTHPTVDDIESLYYKKYLDSKEIEYDGDILICDPFILMNKTDQKKCPSMNIHDTLTTSNTYFSAKNENGIIFGSVKIKTDNICVVLMSDLWNISINDILHRLDVWDYMYIKQFHGIIQFVITKDTSYHLCIHGKGNKNFTIQQNI